jgi:oxygen-independent coproporphyrinogen-3 oxidase
VARQNIRSIIEKYIAKSHFNEVDYGIELNKEEQQRRFVIKSVLHGTGLDVNRYHTLYGHHALQQYPLLQELITADLASIQNSILRLTESGLDYSDAIGPALYSADIKQLITEFELQ